MYIYIYICMYVCIYIYIHKRSLYHPPPPFLAAQVAANLGLRVAQQPLYLCLYIYMNIYICIFTYMHVYRH